MQDLSKELKRIRESMGKSQSEMAEFIGIPQTTWSRYETGKTNPPMKVLFALAEKGYPIKGLTTPAVDENEELRRRIEIAKAFPLDMPIEDFAKAVKAVQNACLNLPEKGEDANLTSLLNLPEPSSGTPNSGASPNLPIASSPGAVEDLSRFRRIASGYPTDITVYKFRKGNTEPMPIHEPDPEGVVFIPIYSQRASAGPGQEETQLTETESLMPIVFEVLGAHKPEHCGIVRVTGDSMTDITLNNGDWAIFDNHDLRGDGLFVISMFGEMRVKRLQYRLSDRKIIIASENQKRYPDPEVVSVKTLDRGDLRIYGRVFSWIHRHPH